MSAVCDNCGARIPADELVIPHRLWERMDEDGPEPAGECPHCGALAYEED
jgi:DNA-directed RNA polymerase subunit RPC12/RpoP